MRQGLPLDAESIAAGIVASAVHEGQLPLAVVEERLGPIPALLIRDMLKVHSSTCSLNVKCNSLAERHTHSMTVPGRCRSSERAEMLPVPPMLPGAHAAAALRRVR